MKENWGWHMELHDWQGRRGGFENMRAVYSTTGYPISKSRPYSISSSCETYHNTAILARAFSAHRSMKAPLIGLGATFANRDMQPTG